MTDIGIGTMLASICPTEATTTIMIATTADQRMRHHLVEVDRDVLPTIHTRRLPAPGARGAAARTDAVYLAAVVYAPPACGAWSGGWHWGRHVRSLLNILNILAKLESCRTDACAIYVTPSSILLMKSDKPQFSIGLRIEDV